MSPAWEGIFKRRTRLTPDESREEIWTPATQLTLGRAVLSTALLLGALSLQSHLLLLTGLGLSMLLDVLDGVVARAKKTETPFGAQIDGVADRLAAAIVLACAVYLEPSTEMAIAAGVVWIQYGAVEQLLNAQFMRFGLWSPDHFYLVNEWVWRLNWTAPAKMVSGLPVMFVAFGLWLPGVVIAAVLVAVRVPCYAWIAAGARELPERFPLSVERPAPTETRLRPEATESAREVDQLDRLAA